MKQARTRSIYLSVIAAAVLSACGGGDDGAQSAGASAGTAPPPATISGVAATGAPIANAVVDIRCAAGTATATTSATGAWSVSAAGLALPCPARRA
ncbi:hypothetical protein [Cupriavidus sp. WS]|uniref:hypothetical protein n=1 Tax=Cupriavidus sp. WS TaxID=1312922 RepID=UPI00039BAF80|nr:hypothetical protein [Cupriavidus sp. WS]